MRNGSSFAGSTESRTGNHTVVVYVHCKFITLIVGAITGPRTNCLIGSVIVDFGDQDPMGMIFSAHCFVVVEKHGGMNTSAVIILI